MPDTLLCHCVSTFLPWKVHQTLLLGRNMWYRWPSFDFGGKDVLFSAFDGILAGRPLGLVLLPSCSHPCFLRNLCTRFNAPWIASSVLLSLLLSKSSNPPCGEFPGGHDAWVGGLILALAWEGWGGWCTLVVASLGDDPSLSFVRICAKGVVESGFPASSLATSLPPTCLIAACLICPGTSPRNWRSRLRPSSVCGARASLRVGWVRRAPPCTSASGRLLTKTLGAPELRSQQCPGSCARSPW